jgi:hypothetical protein
MIIEDYAPVGQSALDRPSRGKVYEGKFIHIVGPDNEYFCICPRALAKYHAHIAQRFSRRRDHLSFVMMPSGDDGRFMTPGWTVVGGGRFRLDRSKHILDLWGSSRAYGRFNGPELQAKIRTVPGWENYRIRVGEPA